ncbi:MAG: hypothetical protein GVY29_04860 [Spirochaetes bacterium]|jgi:hypothetical protein|nr:hypothetical protein [Spirochaetota bacterium]
MTLSTRNRILRLGLVVSVLLAGGATAFAVWLYATAGFEALEDVSVGSSIPWLGLRLTGADRSTAWVAGKSVIMAWFAVFAIVAVLRQFKRTTAPEMFFFSFFLLTIPLETVRLLQIVHQIVELPIMASIVATRVGYFAHAMGILCLFGSSLYAVGVEYQRTGTALGIVALIAFAFAYAVPVDPTVLYPNLLNPIGNQRTVQVVAIVLNVLVLSNFLYARFAQEDRGYFVIAGAVVAITVGNEFLFYAVGPLWAALGGGLLVAGVLTFWRQLHAMYLWIS